MLSCSRRLSLGWGILLLNVAHCTSFALNLFVGLFTRKIKY